MTEPRYLFSAKLFQSPAPFSHVTVSRGGMAFVSGLIGQARDTGELVGPELRAQAEAIFDNLAVLLAEASAIPSFFVEQNQGLNCLWPITVYLQGCTKPSHRLLSKMRCLSFGE